MMRGTEEVLSPAREDYIPLASILTVLGLIVLSPDDVMQTSIINAIYLTRSSPALASFVPLL